MLTEENKASGKQISIERVFDAPRKMVFKAWSDAEQLKRWYAPPGCTLSFCKVDFKVGGAIHTCITIPGGQECWVKGFYQEIKVPEKIVFTSAFADAEGNFVDNPPVGKDPDWPLETVITVTFAEEGGKTRMTVQQNALESVAKRTGAYPSWLLMFDRLEKELSRA